jgi:hypothetical protein
MKTLDELTIPQPPYRMSRPIAVLAMADESGPSAAAADEGAEQLKRQAQEEIARRMQEANEELRRAQGEQYEAAGRAYDALERAKNLVAEATTEDAVIDAVVAAKNECLAAIGANENGARELIQVIQRLEQDRHTQASNPVRTGIEAAPDAVSPSSTPELSELELIQGDDQRARASEASTQQESTVSPAVNESSVPPAPEPAPEVQPAPPVAPLPVPAETQPAQTEVPPAPPEKPASQEARTPDRVALDALNEFRNAADKYGIDSPQAAEARTAYQAAEQAREDALRAARGEKAGEQSSQERPWVREDKALAARIEEARVNLRKAGKDSMLFGAEAKQALAQLLRERVAELQRLLRESGPHAVPMHKYYFEEELNKANQELRELGEAPGWMSRFAGKVRDAYEAASAIAESTWESVRGAAGTAKEKLTPLAERTATARGFLWERIKGLATFGGYEYIQGVRVVTKSSELGKLMEADEQRLISDEHIWELARLRREASGVEKMNEQERAALDMQILETFIRPAYRRNEQVMDEMVWAGMELYKDRMKNVKRTMTGESPLSEKRLKEVEAGIRALLRSRAESLGSKKVGDFSRELRRLTDPKWKWRFGFGAIGTALGAWGLATLAKAPAVQNFVFGGGGATSSFEVGVPGAIPPTGIEAVPVPTAIPPGLEGAAKDTFIEMHKNVWTTMKEYALQHGKALTDQQLMPIVREVIDLNHIAEKEWLMDMVGKFSSRALLEGHVLDLGKLAGATKSAIGMIP